MSEGATVYILRCADGSPSVGITRRTIEERLSEHAQGISRGYTKSRRPVELLHSECHGRDDEAVLGSVDQARRLAMPTWMGIAIGIVSGAGVIAGAVYLAFRPYLATKAPKAWMPSPASEPSSEAVTGARSASQGLSGYDPG